MDSIAGSSSAVSDTPNLPLDGCPSCVVNTEEPYVVAHTVHAGRVVGFYRCHDCDHRWHTSWNLA